MNISLDKNPASLTHWIYSENYPITSNSGILVIGSVSSGKSFFTYRELLPIYIREGGIKTILICSRTGKFDYTTTTELENPVYKDVLIYFIKMEESFKCAQMLRADAIINEYLLKLKDIKSEDDLLKIRKELVNQIRNAGATEFDTIKLELEKLLSIIEKKLVHMSVDEVVDFATMKFETGTKLTYNPALIVYDDYAGTDAFMKPYSDIHKLIYCRRHLHLTMFLLVQSLTTVSTNIRRNCNIFVCFSTMSEADVKLLKTRIPITHTYREVLESFVEIAQAENRDDKLITLFTTYPYIKIVKGTPQCVLKYKNLFNT